VGWATCSWCRAAGWRQVMVSDRRTRIDWAHSHQGPDRRLLPDAEQVVLVQDNLNTHTPASRSAAFAPAEARRLADRLELHSTPKHGSWLNMAEIELTMLAQQCLDRRLADRAILERRWRHGRRPATGPVVGSTGGSRPRTPGSSSSTSTPQLTTDELLSSPDRGARDRRRPARRRVARRGSGSGRRSPAAVAHVDGGQPAPLVGRVDGAVAGGPGDRVQQPLDLADPDHHPRNVASIALGNDMSCYGDRAGRPASGRELSIPCHNSTPATS
jgi:hypothetical protein